MSVQVQGQTVIQNATKESFREASAQFPVEIAQHVVQMLNQVTGGNVNFMTEGGVIIATMQPERLGQIHEGARKIMSGAVDELAITIEDAQKMQGVMPGYNGVVRYKGKRIGCIGLSGDPEKMRPLQKLAAIIAAEEYSKFLSTHRSREILENVVKEIESISAAIQQISAGSINVANQSKEVEAAAEHAEGFLDNVNKVLDIIKSIADQTTLLGYNAAIESARAGVHGQGFGIISAEIRRLSTHSTQSLQDINQILNEIRTSVTEIAKMVRHNTTVTIEQSNAIQNITKSIVHIQMEAEKLIEQT